MSLTEERVAAGQPGPGLECAGQQTGLSLGSWPPMRGQ